MEIQEVFMVENGELVGHTATVDPKNEAVSEIAYCKLPTEDGYKSSVTQIDLQGLSPV